MSEEADRIDLERSAGAANADAAPAAAPTERDGDAEGAHARRAEAGQGGADQLADKARETKGDRQEALLDEGVEETFPASDPVSVKRIT